MTTKQENDKALRYFTLDNKWPLALTFGVSLLSYKAGTLCVMFHLGSYVMIVGPHFPPTLETA